MTKTTTPDPQAGAESIASFGARAKAWAQENLLPSAPSPSDNEIEHFTPEVMAANRALQRRLFEGGFAGITWPKEFGGGGLSPAHEEAFLVATKGYQLPDFGLLSDTTFSTCVPTMIAHASAQFLERLVPRVLQGEILVCQFFSEPEAGSDLAAARTRATRQAEGWIIDGQKIWSSWAHLADWGMCLARTDWDAPKHSGLTWFAIPCNAPGLTIRPIRQIGGGVEFCEEFFTSVVVPDTDRIGDVNDGWQVTQTMLFFERGAGRATNDGELVGPGVLPQDLVGLATRTRSKGDERVRQLIATAHSNDFVGRALWNRIAAISRSGDANPGVAAYGKLFSGTYLPIRARIGVDIGGALAMSWLDSEPDGEATSVAYLRGRTQAIAGGTNEMQRNAIAERALGMPRDPNPSVRKPFAEVIHASRRSAGEE